VKLAALVVADVAGGAPMSGRRRAFPCTRTMSMRTMADSSSKRTREARAVSFYRRRWGEEDEAAMGRLGSLRPARLRRMALATTVSAAS